MATQQLDKVSIIPQDEPRALAVVTPMEMLNRAVESGASLEMVEKLMTLQERWEKNQSRKAFDNAIAAAKAEIPNITKNREVDFTSAKGRTNYRYEDLGEIARVVSPILAKHGLSYRYRTTSVPNEPITVTCIVSHRDGHSEENTLCAGRDDSGNKNSIQAIGSTSTYLQRMTLKAALGLAVSNDDDGKTAEAVETVTQKQADDLTDLIEAHGKNRAQFLKWAKVERFEDIPASAYDACVKAIEYKAPAK